MGKKTLTNAHCLLELIENAPTSVIKTFCAIPECRALERGFNWTQDDEALHPALVEHVKHLRKEQRDPAEREALRVLRLARTAVGTCRLVNVYGPTHLVQLAAQRLRQITGLIGAVGIEKITLVAHGFARLRRLVDIRKDVPAISG